MKLKLLRNPKISSFADSSVLLSSYNEGRSRNPISSLDSNIPIPKDYKYYPYQIAGIQVLAKRIKSTSGHGVLLADEMGLGKTLQAIGYINSDPTIRKVLVFCPKILVDEAWDTGFEKFLTRNLRVGIIPMNRRLDYDRIDIFIANYDKVTGEDGFRLCEEIRKHDWDLIICDECQNLKNSDTQRATRICGKDYSKTESENYPGIMEAFKRKLFMTGTPIESSPIDAWRALSICEPELFGNKFEFGKRYCNLHEVTYFGKKAWDWKGKSNEKELNVLIYANCGIRRLKKDVLSLPEKKHSIVELKVSSQTQKEIEELNEEEEIDDFIEKLSESEELILRLDKIFAEKLSESEEEDDFNEESTIDSMLSGSGLRDVSVAFQNIARYRAKIGKLKLTYACAYIQKILDRGEKAVVFAWHVNVIEGILDYFKKYNPVCAYGSKKSPNLSLTFERDDSCRLFVGQIKSAGAGITLTKAHTAIFVEMDFTPGIMAQAEDRIHRIGQTHPCDIIYLALPNTIDGKIADILIRKNQTIRAVIDSDSGKDSHQIDQIYKLKLGEEREKDARQQTVVNFQGKENLVRETLIELGRNCGRSLNSFQLGFCQQTARYKRFASDKQYGLAIKILTEVQGLLSDDQRQRLGLDNLPETQDQRLCTAAQTITVVEPSDKNFWSGFRESIKSSRTLSDKQRNIVLTYVSNYRNQVNPQYLEEFGAILPTPDEFKIGLTQEYIDLLQEIATFCKINELSNDKDLLSFALSKSGSPDSKSMKEIAKKLESLAEEDELLKSVQKYIVSPALFNSRILSRAIDIQKEYEEAGSSPELDIEEAKDKAYKEIISQFKSEDYYSSDVKSACLQAIQMLASVCDGAQTEDTQGFNKLHTRLGHKLSKLSEIPDVYMPFALFCVRFYKKQLGSMLLRRAGITGEDLQIAIEQEARKARKTAKELKKSNVPDVSKPKVDFWSTPFGYYLSECVK